MKNYKNFIYIIILSIFLTQCSSYNLKKDINKSGVIKKTPKWYVEFDRQDKKWMYETATSVSPDMELSVKKSIILAKSKLADRYNGKISSELKLLNSEMGSNESYVAQSSTQEEIINIIKGTLVKNYFVEKVEIFYTKNKSYRSYVKIKVSKDNIDDVIDNIKNKENLRLSKNFKNNYD